MVLGCFLCPAGPASAAPPPLAVYGSLPGFERAAISPSGGLVAVIATVQGKRMLLILNSSGTPVYNSPIGDHKVRGLFWAGEGMVLLKVSQTAVLGMGFTADKAELSAMLVVPIDGSKPWTIFEKYNLVEGGIRGFYGVVERDGAWFGYFSGITLDRLGKTELTLVSGKPVLYEVDLQKRKYRKIAPRPDSQDIYRTWLIGAEGKVDVTFDFAAGNGEWSIRNESGGKFATGKAPLGDVDLVGFGATPGTIIYSDQKDDQNWRWIEVPVNGSPSKEILQEESIERAIFDDRTRHLIGYARQSDTPSYKFFDPYRNKVVSAAQKAFPGLGVRLMDWNDAFDRLIVETEGPGDAGTWWWVDIKTGSANVLGSSYPIEAGDVAPMRMIRYKAGDGTEIAAVLTVPPGRAATNLPVVVFPHGGPTARDYPGFDWWAQAFAARGYAVLQPNFRGSSGYGTEFQLAGRGEWGRKMQTDISDGLAQLARDGIVDPKRACIMGASYGGYAALAGVTLQHGLYRCAVSVAGIGDLAKMVAVDIATSGGDPTLRRALKVEVGYGQELKAVSPIRLVETADAPVLLIHGKDDTVVSFDQSNDMAAALRRAGKPVELVTLPGEDHWLSKTETRLTMLQSAVAFVEKHNPPDAGK